MFQYVGKGNRLPSDYEIGLERPEKRLFDTGVLMSINAAISHLQDEGTNVLDARIIVPEPMVYNATQDEEFTEDYTIEYYLLLRTLSIPTRD